MAMASPTELVSYIAKALADEPDQVAIEQTPGDRDDVIVIELRVASDDRGKLIGKKGRTAHAIRTLLNAASDGHNRISLEIID